MSDLSYDVAQAIVSLKYAQDAVVEFYKTKNFAYQRTPEGLRELIRLRSKLDQKLEVLASFVVSSFGEVAEQVVQSHREPFKHESAYTEWQLE